MKTPILPIIKKLFWKIQSLLFMLKPLNSKSEPLGNGSKNIKRLNSSDSSQLSTLLSSASKEDLQFFTPHSFNTKTFEQLFNTNHYKAWGIFINKQLVGYSFVRCVFTNKAYAGYFVHPNFRKQGFSQNLFQAAKVFSKQNHLNLYTTVSPTNIASLKTSNGFSKVGIRPNGDWILKHDL